MLSHFSLPELLLILAIVILVFGTKKLGSFGSDLGSAVKGFRKALKDDDEPKTLPKDTTAQKDHSEPPASKNP